MESRKSTILTERVSKRIGGWTNKCLSAGGKEVLIKSVIQSIPTYTMPCFRVPVTISNDIERLCTQFWWGDKASEKRMHWSTWQELCKPKSKGGMSFRNLISFNKALLAKQVWRLIRYPNSLVARILKAKYYHDKDIFYVTGSFIWRSLLWGSELLKKGLRWKVKDGNKVRLFKDAWLPNLPMGMMVHLHEGLENMMVADIITDDNKWDKELMDAILLPIEVEDVLQNDRPIQVKEDFRFWKYDPRGSYCVKSGYLMDSNFYDSPISTSVDRHNEWWKFLWSFDLPHRVKIFAWRAFKNIIPTEMNLKAHHVPLCGICGWCRKGWSTTSHTLLFCEKIRDKWKCFDFWNTLKKCEGCSIEEIGETMHFVVSRKAFERWLMGMWLVWKGLCEEKHRNKTTSSTNLQHECDTHIQGFSKTKLQAVVRSRILPKEGGFRWRSPKRGRFRLDVDYGVDEGLGKGGVGAIVRDENDNIVVAMAMPIRKAATILHGELTAIMHGIQRCMADGISHVEVFTDSLLAVHVIAEEDDSRSVLYEDMLEIFEVAKKSCVIKSVLHARREANRAAHKLASFAKSSDTTTVWYDNWPSWLLDIVTYEST